MTSVRTLLSIAALAATTLATSGCAATNDLHDSHHAAQAAAVQVAQANPGSPAMGMHAGAPPPAYGEQMRAMQEMHEKMLAARTPEERNALMAAQMKLMQSGMNMMGGMGGMGGTGHEGGGAMMGKPGDDAARQGMLDQRMDMMESMLQMMMDRMQSVPATK